MAPKKRVPKKQQEMGESSSTEVKYDSDDELNALIADHNKDEHERASKKRKTALPQMAMISNISAISYHGELPHLESGSDDDEGVDEGEDKQGQHKDKLSIGAKNMLNSMSMDKIAFCTIKPHYNDSMILLSSYVGTISQQDLLAIDPTIEPTELGRIFLLGLNTRVGTRLLRNFYHKYTPANPYSITHKEAISMMQFVSQSMFMESELLPLPCINQPQKPEQEDEEERLEQCLRNIALARSLMACMNIGGGGWKVKKQATFLCGLIRLYLDKRAFPTATSMESNDAMDMFATCLVNHENDSGGMLMTLSMMCNLKCFDAIKPTITTRWFKKLLGEETEGDGGGGGIAEVAALLPRVVRKMKGDSTGIYTLMRIVDHCITPAELALISTKAKTLQEMNNHFLEAHISSGINAVDRDVITATCDVKHLVSMAQIQSRHNYVAHPANDDSESD